MTRLIISLFLKSSGPLLGFGILYIISINFSKEILGFYMVFMQALIFLGILIRGGNEFILLKFGKELEVSANPFILMQLHRRVFVNFTFFLIIFFTTLNTFDFSNQFIQKLESNTFLFGFSALSFAIFSLSVTYLVSVEKINESIFFQSLLFQIMVLILLTVLPNKIISIFVIFIVVSNLLTIVIYLKFNQFKVFYKKKVPLPSGRVKGFSLSVSEFLMFNSDLLVLSFFVTLETVAVYALASRVVMMYGFYVQVQNAYVANLVASALNDTSVKISEIFRMALLTNLKVLPLYTLGIFIVSELILMFFGKQYQDISKYVSVLLVSGVFGILFGFSVTFYHLITEDRKGFMSKKYNYLASMIFMVMLLFSAYVWGVEGVVFTILIFKAIYYSSFYLLSLDYVGKMAA